MTLPPIPTYTARELEEKALSFLKQHYQSITLPVDIEYLIEIQGFDIREIPGIYSQSGTKALPVYYNDIAAVCIDLEHSDRYPELARFTLAEELGHILLHKPVFQDCQSLDESIKRYLELPGKSLNELDRNARYLGAAILIPRLRLAEDLDDMLQNPLSKAFSTLEEVRDWAADALCRKYRVSAIALRHRINSHPFRPWDDQVKRILSGK